MYLDANPSRRPALGTVYMGVSQNYGYLLAVTTIRTIGFWGLRCVPLPCSRESTASTSRQACLLDLLGRTMVFHRNTLWSLIWNAGALNTKTVVVLMSFANANRFPGHFRQRL